MPNFPLAEILYLFSVGLIFAALEVQIEGENGWASKLPTRRFGSGGWFSKIYRLILFGKDATLYHLLIFTLLLFFLHYPYFANGEWNFGEELRALSLFFLISVVWDFLWFLINPHYGLSRFGAQNVWWHKKWFLFIPIDYWSGIILSFLFYTRFSLNASFLKEWLVLFVLYLALIFTVFGAVSFARKFKLTRQSK